MLYGDPKRRQMARSILPSTARRASAARSAGIRRRSRRRTGQQLRSLIAAPGACAAAEASDDARFDALAWPQHQIKDAVWERRLNDKVAPLQRWAVAFTRDLPSEGRLDAVRAVLPNDLIGRHAISHIDFLDHFTGHLVQRRRPATVASPRPGPDQLRAEFRRLLAAGVLGAFNAHMKRYPCLVDGEHWHENPCRTLAGAHDVEAFIADCYTHRRREPAPLGGRWVYHRRPWLAGLHAWASSGLTRGSHEDRRAGAPEEKGGLPLRPPVEHGGCRPDPGESCHGMVAPATPPSQGEAMNYGIVIIATAVAMILVQRADAFEDLLRAAAGALRRCLREPGASVQETGESGSGEPESTVTVVPEDDDVGGRTRRAS